MDLRTWIADQHADAWVRFEQGVGAMVPLEMWKATSGRGSASIAHLVFHASYHADLAINSVLRGEGPLLSAFRRPLGLAGLPASAGLGEAESPDLTAALDLDVLGDYAEAVRTANQVWIEGASEVAFGAPAFGPAGLELAGVAEADVAWLYELWAGKPAAYFVQWEALGHLLAHVGEMVSVRNRLGLSPF